MSTSIPPVSSLTNTSSSGSTTSNDTLGPQAFLQLLTTELENQDPTNPSDPTESITQLAQFSELQYQSQLTTAFQAFQSNFATLQATSLVGKQVTAEVTSSSGTNTSTVTGTVSTIDVENGEPYFTMIGSSGQTMTNSSGQPLLFSLSQIVGVGAAAAATTNSAGTGTTGSNSGSGGGG